MARKACVALACALFAMAASVALAQTSAITFYDAIKSDSQHKLIAKAIDADTKGELKAMLQRRMPVTALVPTDAAFVVAGLKYKMGSRVEDMQKVMQNTCLINAILRQHIIPGVYTVDQLKKLYSKPSMLITKKVSETTGQAVSVNWPLKFKGLKSNGALTVASAALDPKTKKPAINGTVVAPMNVAASGGMLHNINQLLLPTTNMTRLMQITNCTMVGLPPTSK